MIQFINVSKEFQNGTIGLKKIDVKIEEGEFVFLVGASGAGKSTFTKLLIRELLPTEGNILVNGKSITRLKQRQIPHYRRNIGFIFQNYRLLGDRTAFENVAFAVEVLGATRREVERKVDYALHLVGLDDRKTHFPDELSGGEQQRVAIARAIVTNPKIILADEPTGNLDSVNGNEVMNLLLELNKEGSTVVMVTHSEENARMAGRLIRMMDGNILTESRK